MERITLESLLGQRRIFQEITKELFNKSYLIKGQVGTGKKYTLNKLHEYAGLQKMTMPFYLEQDMLSEDYRPFLSAISKNESRIIKNGTQIIKNFSGLVPVFGEVLEEILKIEVKYPAEFTETEINIISQIKAASQNKKIILICEEINVWDEPSRILLKKIISNLCNCEFSKFSCICSSSDLNDSGFGFTGEFELNTFNIKNSVEIMRAILPKTTLDDNTIKTVCGVCGCNIGIAKYIIEKLDTSTPFSDNEIRSHVVSTIKNDKVVLLLDKASVIGSTSSKKLLQTFTRFEEFEFMSTLNETLQSHYMSCTNDNVAFLNKTLWNIFFSYNNSKKEFHFELAKCLKSVMPTGYKRIGLEYLLAGFEEKAALYYALSAIYYYIAYKIKPFFSEYELKIIKAHGFFDSYSMIIESYEKFFFEKIDTISELPATNTEEMNFEIEYLKTFIYLNSDIDCTYYRNIYNNIQRWVKASDFQEQSPEQWLRAATIYLEIGVELHVELDVQTLGEIQKVVSKYRATDVNIEIFHYDFLAKSNSIYSIDIASNNTFEAVRFIEDRLEIERFSYKYLIFLNNALANAVVIGEKKAAFEYCSKAISYLRKNDCKSGYFASVVINNILLALLCWDPTKFTLNFPSIEKVMEKFIRESKNNIAKILLKNNLGVFYIYCGQIENARKIFNELYKHIKYNSDIDDYYSYFIKNNYYLIEYIVTEKLDTQKFIKELSELRPLDLCMKYFNARNQYMAEILEHKFKFDLSNERWNKFEETLVLC